MWICFVNMSTDLLPSTMSTTIRLGKTCSIGLCNRFLANEVINSWTNDFKNKFYTVSTKKLYPQTMYGRIVKSKRILTKLRVLDCEYICDRIAKFHKKILFITWVINIQILTTKYFSFRYSVTYCSQALRRSCPQSTWDSASVNSWNTRLHHCSSVAS